MYTTLQEVYDQYLKVKPDSNLLSNIKMFRIAWAQKNDEHIAYLGNSLIGSYRIIFSTLDENTFFEALLGLDYKEIQQELYNVKGIDKNMKTISNCFYLTCVYLMYLFTNSKYLSDKQRVEGVKEVFYVMSYKMLSSLNTHYFKYPIDESVAKAINERMTLKFLVKRFDNWQNVIDYKSEDVLKKGIHENRISDMSNADDATRVISDIQTKYRDMYKNHFAVLLEVNQQNERITSSSLITKTEDGEGIKDIVNINYLKSIINYPNSFINQDLVYIVMSLFKGVDEQQMFTFLKYLSQEEIKEKDWIVETTIISSLEYLISKKRTKDFVKYMYEILLILKSYYSSSNTRNQDNKKLKKILQDLVKKSVKRANGSVCSKLSIASIIYIFMRSAMK